MSFWFEFEGKIRSRMAFISGAPSRWKFSFLDKLSAYWSDSWSNRSRISVDVGSIWIISQMFLERMRAFKLEILIMSNCCTNVKSKSKLCGSSKRFREFFSLKELKNSFEFDSGKRSHVFDRVCLQVWKDIWLTWLSLKTSPIRFSSNSKGISWSE